MNVVHTDRKIIVLENFRRFARLCYAWPEEHEELNPGRIFYIKSSIVALLIFYNPIGVLIAVVKNTLDGHLGIILDDIISLNSGFYCLMVWVSTIFKIQPMAGLLLKFSDFYEENKYKVSVRESVKIYTRFISQWTYYILFAFTLQGAMFLFLDIHCFKTASGPRPAFCKGVLRFYVPFIDRNSIWAIVLVDLYQTVTVLTICLAAAPIISALLPCVHFINLQLRQLGDEFQEIFANPELPLQKKEDLIKRWISKHVDIIEQFHCLNNYHRTSLFAHILFTGLSIAIAEYMIIEQKQVMLILILVGYLGALAFSCIAGHLITAESEKFLKRINFDILWYEEPICIQKYYKMITIRAQRSFILEVGQFSTLSAAFFLSILKSSYSFVVLLQNT